MSDSESLQDMGRSMNGRRIPREVHIAYVIDRRTGGTHNVLEVCGKERGVRFVMAQDSETAKERDKYKLRAHLQAEKLADLERQLAELREAATEAEDLLWKMQSIQPYGDDIHYVGGKLNAALKEQAREGEQ